MEVLLRHLFTAGLTLRYQGSTRVHQEIMHSGVTTGENDHEWEAVMVQHVLAVDVDGAGHVVTRAVPFDSTSGGVEAALAAQRQVTYVQMDSLGIIHLASTPNPPSTYSFPEHAIEIGKGWQAVSEFPLPPGGQVAHVPFLYTLRDVADYQGVTCAVIEVHAPRNDWEVALSESSDVAIVALETTGIIYFDYLRGFMIRSEMETTTSPRLGPQTVTTVTSTVQELIGLE